MPYSKNVDLRKNIRRWPLGQRSSRAKRRPLHTAGLLIRLHVAVKTGEKKVHPKIGKDDRTKSHNGEQGSFVPSPLTGKSRMQEGGVDKPRNQRPGFLRVPAPIASPGITGPCRTGDDTKGQQGKSNGDRLVVDLIQYLRGWQPAYWVAP